MRPDRARPDILIRPNGQVERFDGCAVVEPEAIQPDEDSWTYAPPPGWRDRRRQPRLRRRPARGRLVDRLE